MCPVADVTQGVAGPRPTDGFLGFDANHDAAGFNSVANGTPDGAGFDDKNGYIDIANPSSGVLDPGTGNYSMSLWFQTPSDGHIYTLVSKGSGGHDGWLLRAP